MVEIARPNNKALTSHSIKYRFNMPVAEWNRGPEFPVKLWDKYGKRSVLGQIMREAGVLPRYLNVDNYDDSIRYENTHIVPNDVVPINPDWAWIVDKISPATLRDEGRPMGGLKGHAYPLALNRQREMKVWDLLVRLNDGNMAVDIEEDRVLQSITWQTRAFWIRELLRRYGVGIAFRLPRAS